MTKILTLTTSFPRSEDDFMGVFVRDLCRNFSSDMDVTILAPNSPGGKEHEHWGLLSIIRFNYFIPKKIQSVIFPEGIEAQLKKSVLAKIQFPFFMLAFLVNVLRHAREADVIHAHWEITALPAIIAKMLYGIPVVVTLHGGTLHSTFPKLPLLKYLLRFVLDRCDKIVTVSEPLRSVMEDMGYHVEVIYNGTDMDIFKKGDKTRLREQLKLPLDKIIIFSLSTLIERKGIKYLIWAAAKVKDCYVVIGGEGRQKQELQDLVNQNNIKNVIFVGSVDHSKANEWFAAADIFIIPSLSETGPITLLEAMASENIVITTPVGLANSLIQEGHNGYFIPFENADAIVEKITLAMNNLGIGKTARETLEKKGISWRTCASKYESIFNEVLERAK